MVSLFSIPFLCARAQRENVYMGAGFGYARGETYNYTDITTGKQKRFTPEGLTFDMYGGWNFGKQKGVVVEGGGVWDGNANIYIMSGYNTGFAYLLGGVTDQIQQQLLQWKASVRVKITKPLFVQFSYSPHKYYLTVLFQGLPLK